MTNSYILTVDSEIHWAYKSYEEALEAYEEIFEKNEFEDDPPDVAIAIVIKSNSVYMGYETE